MKYTVDILIKLPRNRVIELFDNPDNLFKWQPELKKFEPISGEPGQSGSKSRLVYDMNGRNLEMIETIIKYDLPEEFSATYDAKNVHNHVVNRFTEEGESLTRWSNENVFEFSGFMKLVGFFMKGAFPKQTLKDMNSFKIFAEAES